MHDKSFSIIAMKYSCTLPQIPHQQGTAIPALLAEAFRWLTALEHQALTHLCKEEQFFWFSFLQGWLLAGIRGFWKVWSFLVG